MKTVGKQLQEARLAKNWTPELAARETKIKVERVRDLEADDYSNFTSPTYARGFVRTYARALGLDEYRILRQLDNKLPDDDSANIVTDTGVAYLPETAMPKRAAHRDFTGLYVVTALGGVVVLVIAFVLFQAYRVGELSRWFATPSDSVATTTSGTTNLAANPTGPDSAARALPIDSNVAPPIVEPAAETNAPAAVAPGTPGVSPRALPVDPSLLGAAPATNAPAATPPPVQAARALPVNPSDLTNATAATPPAPPRALPVDLSELTNGASATPGPGMMVAANTAALTPPADPAAAPHTIPHPSSTARQSNSGPVMEPSLPAVEPSAVAPTAPAVIQPNTAVPPADPAPQIASAPSGDKRLVLTASQDSFVRVTNIDQPDAAKPLYASVLKTGQSVGFDGKKFSINVGVPSAVDIKLDGVNYGPHSDREAPETFTVQSHLP